MVKQTRIKLEDSPLYQLSSKKHLAHLLGLKNTSILHKFHANRKSYNVFKIAKPGKTEKRPVEEPNDFLKLLHSRIQRLLAQIETPAYLHSGVKGKNHIANAKVHSDKTNCLQMDLHHFYQTVRKMYVAEMFMTTFKMPQDISLLLSDISTIPKRNGNGDAYLPTGSPLSQLLAFWTYKKTFDDIHNVALLKGIVFSLYVDDMTFSSNNEIPKSFEKFVINRIIFTKLEINKEKTKRTGNNHPKIITGCVAKNGILYVRNKKRNEIIKLLKQQKNTNITRKIIGKITSQQQIEKGFMEHTKQIKLTNQKRKKHKSV